MAKRDRFAECVESSRGESDVRVLRADLKWAIKEIRRLRKLVAEAAKAEPAPEPGVVTYADAREHLDAGGMIELVVDGGGVLRKGSGDDAQVRMQRSDGVWLEWEQDAFHAGMNTEAGAYALLSGEGDV